MLRDDLVRILPTQRVLDEPIELAAHAPDASFYSLVPQAVVLPQSVEQVAALFRLSHERRIPLTFRAAGTSLSGQSITNGILVDISRGFDSIDILDGGRAVRVGPGMVGARVNRVLKAHARKIGPDPASIATARIGGILSNNSSGMCCGVEQNAYHTLRSLTFLLPSGTCIDTAARDADEQLRHREPALYRGLMALRARLLADAALAGRVREKYRRKNTTGYALNALLDFERPIDILSHVLIGAEGTLAFIAEAVLDTVPDLPVKHTGLLFFETIHAACAAIGPLRDVGAKALELMDRASLRSVQDKPGMPALLRELPPDAAGLLVEFQAECEAERDDLREAARGASARLRLLTAPAFTGDASEQAKLWQIRSGMFPSVGAVRARGTTVIIEDVAFPVEQLAVAAVDLTNLFARHGYSEGIIFGHARDGNLHFVITQGFADANAIDRYARFLDDMVELVVRRHDGALKAEHGTGRNMAPFVEAEWGPEALAIMRELKKLCDPQGLLNPGVIIPDGPRAHLQHLKALPAVADEVDRCIECGFCEPQCPSRELTLTPRQRIAVRRAGGEFAQHDYYVMDTCAACGMCATACPVGIDTGSLVKRLRHESHTPRQEARAVQVAGRIERTKRLARLGLRAARIAQAIFPTSRLAGIPRPAPKRPRTAGDGADALYFPSCVSRTMGPSAGNRPLPEVLIEVAARAGVQLHIPDDVEGTCCGVPFSSKGYTEAHAVAANAAIERLWRWSDGGRLPVVVDTSPCTYGLLHCEGALTTVNRERHGRLRILDVVAYAHDELLPNLAVRQKQASVVLHPVCSVVKMGLPGRLEGLARACSDRVVVPADAGCCGFAGDRGFLVPELTASATRREAQQVDGGHGGFYSSSRTCEVGMSRATGRDYRSIVYLLEEATRPAR
ncbi:MAG TPA: FAD-binding and (Fe-S)-binding domain-containing protein [Myxococcales bacterium]|nr:FAD-binding and (Fe-S)-binding domain-containing protein [Myxococcales bacterium]